MTARGGWVLPGPGSSAPDSQILKYWCLDPSIILNPDLRYRVIFVPAPSSFDLRGKGGRAACHGQDPVQQLLSVLSVMPLESSTW